MFGVQFVACHGQSTSKTQLELLLEELAEQVAIGWDTVAILCEDTLLYVEVHAADSICGCDKASCFVGHDALESVCIEPSCTVDDGDGVPCCRFVNERSTR